MPQGQVVPVNAILIAGTALHEEKEVGTATATIPGRIAIDETNDYTCTNATTNSLNPIGVFDVEPGQLRTTSYDAGDQARIIRGPIRVLLTLLASENVTRGDYLVPAALGKVKKAAAITATIATGTITNLGAITVAGSYEPGGKIVAQARTSSNVTTDAEIICDLLI